MHPAPELARARQQDLCRQARHAYQARLTSRLRRVQGRARRAGRRLDALRRQEEILRARLR